MKLDVDSTDTLTGLCEPGLAVDQVEVRCDGRRWATVPTTAGVDGPGFRCQLPPTPASDQIFVTVHDGSSKYAMAALSVPPRRVITNAHGLMAQEVLATHRMPFHATPWLHFDGARLTVSGEHLPPAGDPASLKVVFGPGVAYDFVYPLPSGSFDKHFWYWPNAHLSTFTLTIDLPACSPGSDPFAFTFEYANGDPTDTLAGQVSDPLCRQVFIPPRLDAGIGFPRDSDQLTRVQTWSVDHSVTFTGYSAYRTIAALLSRYGVEDRTGTRVLDWGCGHGRVSRHFIQNWTRARIYGADIDGGNITWCNQNLSGTFVQVPLFPPTTFEDETFDAIFGISVMTHLTAEAQAAWLEELARILKPDGVALITFAGRGAVAWSSIFRGPDWWKDWTQSGFDDRQQDTALAKTISDGTYYRSTMQTTEYTVGAWCEHFEIERTIEDILGNLDMAVLRKRRR